MSVPQYRKAAAVALVAGLGLSLAACSTKSDDKDATAGGKVTITVDCQPVGAQKELLKNWNDDVAEFQKQNPDIVIKSVSVGEQCNNPPDFTARLAGGTVTDVFYGYMTDLQQVLDSGQAMDITPYVNKDTIPTWDSVDPALKEVFTDGGKLYAVPVKNYSMGLVYNKVAVPAGRARRRTTRRRPGPRSGPPPRRSPRSATASPATRSTAPATPAAGTSPPRSTRRAARC